MTFFWGFVIASVSASLGYIVGSIMAHGAMMDDRMEQSCPHGLPCESCPNCRPS